jgi:hypothetical protein
VTDVPLRSLFPQSAEELADGPAGHRHNINKSAILFYLKACPNRASNRARGL